MPDMVFPWFEGGHRDITEFAIIATVNPWGEKYVAALRVSGVGHEALGSIGPCAYDASERSPTQQYMVKIAYKLHFPL